MNFVEVERLPEKRRPKKSLKNLFNEFMNMNIKLAKVDLNERDYKSVAVAYSVLRNAAKKHDYPIKVYLRDGNVYFMRRDI